MTNPKTTIQNPELWQFPMDYPMSIIGHEGQKETLFSEVALILAEIFPDFDPATLLLKPSKTGRFYAVRAQVHLTSADQVNRLYGALDKASSVRTVV